MEFNWATFFLEIINFLVLIWIVKHFFYKPIREAIDKRRSKINEEISNAKNMQSEAEETKALYASRLVIWEEEKRRQQALLTQEIEAKKKQQLLLLEKQIVELREKEREKDKQVQKKKLDLLLRENERQALDQGSLFAAKLLKDVSSQDLENRLVELFLKNIHHFSRQKKDELVNIFHEENPVISITSAYPLPQKQKDDIQHSVQDLFSNKIHYKYKLNPELIAGVRVDIGSYVMRANIGDELKFFSDAANGL
ncbi:MAG: F0F1 ATP synthase subunit delta [Gammaproteobacteria bacterium]|nr:F0F1 ATP synthase subunit delta [Gammaproteobacteria bacterium]